MTIAKYGHGSVLAAETEPEEEAAEDEETPTRAESDPEEE